MSTSPYDQKRGQRISAQGVRDIARQSDKNRPGFDGTAKIIGVAGTGYVEPPVGWFFGKVTEASDFGNAARYGWVQIGASGNGTVGNIAGVISGNTTILPGINLAYVVTGSDLEVGDAVMIRPSPYTGGTTYDLLPVAGSSGQWFKVTGNLANGLYPAVPSTFNASNQSYTDGSTTVQIRAGNAESLTNGTRYLGCAANGLSNGTIGNASNSTVYVVTAGSVSGATVRLGNVGFAGNFGNAGNATNMTLLANGAFANLGGSNWTFAYNVGNSGNSTFSASQWMIGITVGNLSVALPIFSANVSRPGWLDIGNQTIGGTKTFTSGTANTANTTNQATNIVANRVIAMGGSDSYDTSPLMVVPAGATNYLDSAIIFTSTFIYCFQGGVGKWSVTTGTGNQIRMIATDGMYVSGTSNVPIQIQTNTGIETGLYQNLQLQRGNGANCTLRIRGGWIIGIDNF